MVPVLANPWFKFLYIFCCYYLFRQRIQAKGCCLTLILRCGFSSLRLCLQVVETLHNLQNLSEEMSSKPFIILKVCIMSAHRLLWARLGSPFKKTVGTGEIGHNKQFLLFLQCFLFVWRTFCHFHLIWNYRLQTLSVWKILKFVFWERVNM